MLILRSYTEESPIGDGKLVLTLTIMNQVQRMFGGSIILL